jgi:hypothetical protein
MELLPGYKGLSATGGMNVVTELPQIWGGENSLGMMIHMCRWHAQPSRQSISVCRYWLHSSVRFYRDDLTNIVLLSLFQHSEARGRLN